MKNNRRYNHFVIFALILIVGLGLALTLPWLANSQSLAAHYKNAPTGPGPCYAQNANSLTPYEHTNASAVQQAVDEANPGDVIKLAGTCTGVEMRAGLTQTVYISKTLRLEGGHTESDWTLEPDPHTYTTTLDANDGGRVVVISGTVDVILDSLFLTGGLAPDGNGNLDKTGGGIWSNEALTFTNSTVYSNTAQEGGGMYNDNGSPTLTNVVFSGNSAEYGGGMSNNANSPLLTDVVFSGNSAISLGGGMFNENSSPELTNVVFSGNSANDGGGMFSDLSSPALTNVVFSGNSATDGGGGMFNHYCNSPRLTNVTFSGNSADSFGGGIFNNNSSPVLRNSILWNNQDINGTGTISNTIYHYSAFTIIIQSLVQGAGASSNWTENPSYVNGGGNIDEDPMFITPIDPSTTPTTTGNLRLQSSSPAIDAGNNDLISGFLTDLDNKPRVVDGDMDGTETVDMGAYEYQTPDLFDVYLPMIFR